MRDELLAVLDKFSQFIAELRAQLAASQAEPEEIEPSPGPWKYDEDENEIVDAEGNTIVEFNYSSSDADQDAANGRFIVAAVAKMRGKA